MVETNIKYLNEADNRPFIEIYEDEIKRLLEKNEEQQQAIEDLTQEKNNLVNLTQKLQDMRSGTQVLVEKIAVLQKEVNALKEKEAVYPSAGQQKEQEKLAEITQETSQQLAAEKAEIGEVLLEAKVQAKTLIRITQQEIEEMKKAAHQEVAEIKGNAAQLNEKLEEIKHKNDQVMIHLIKEVRQILG